MFAPESLCTAHYGAAYARANATTLRESIKRSVGGRGTRRWSFAVHNQAGERREKEKHSMK